MSFFIESLSLWKRACPVTLLGKGEVQMDFSYKARDGDPKILSSLPMTKQQPKTILT
jgi:hypothetical protein